MRKLIASILLIGTVNVNAWDVTYETANWLADYKNKECRQISRKYFDIIINSVFAGVVKHNDGFTIDRINRYSNPRENKSAETYASHFTVPVELYPLRDQLSGNEKNVDILLFEDKDSCYHSVVNNIEFIPYNRE